MELQVLNEQPTQTKRTLLMFFATMFIMLACTLAMPQDEAQAYWMQINKGTQVATVYTDNGTPVRAMLVSTGKYGPTPEGWFRSQAKYRWREMIGNCYSQYLTRITGSYLFHSVPYWAVDPSQMDQAYFNCLGSPASSGCVRACTEDAKWVYDNCPLGMSIYIFTGNSSQDPLPRPELPYISYGSGNRAWDPTDPDPANPYYMYPNGVSITNTDGAGAYVGGTWQLGFSLTTRGQLNYLTNKVIWSSNNTNVASVDSKGVVTGKSVGSAVITATTVNGISTSCTFTVGAPTSISVENVEVFRGTKTTFLVDMTPDNTWQKVFKASVADYSIAAVDTGIAEAHTITGKRTGTTTISVSTPEDSFADSSQLTVYDYVVVYQNWDDSVLSTQHIGYKDMVVIPDVPTRPSDGTYDYSFEGWDKTFDPVAHTVTLQAQYLATAIEEPDEPDDSNSDDSTPEDSSLDDSALDDSSLDDSALDDSSLDDSTLDDSTSDDFAPVEAVEEAAQLSSDASLGVSSLAPQSMSERELAGIDRYETMRSIAFATYTHSSHAIIVVGSNFPDALSAAALAGVNNAPIILNESDKLSWDAYFTLYALDVTSVDIAGGTGVISSAVESAIEKVLQDNCAAGQTSRIARYAGVDRMATAESIYANGLKGKTSSRTAILSTNSNFADALSISAYAFATGSPIFLTKTASSVTTTTNSYLTTENFDRLIIVGGTGVISTPLENIFKTRFGSENVIRLGEDDRYSTSIAIAQWSVAQNVGLAWDGVAITTGMNFPDALAGATLQGTTGSVILLMDDNVPGVQALSAISSKDIEHVNWLGGVGVVTLALRRAVITALG